VALIVTLFLGESDGEDKAVVCVRDTREGICFEISTDPYLALEVYYHPFAYRDQDSRLAAAAGVVKILSN
jgi:hypothetical protein